MVEIGKGHILRCELRSVFLSLATLFERWSFAICIATERHHALIMHAFEPLTIKLGCCAIVSFLDRLVLQVVNFKELEGGLVAAIDEHS